MMRNENIIIRYFVISHAKHLDQPQREVVQLHYVNRTVFVSTDPLQKTEWPDFGKPENTNGMAELITELDIRKKSLDEPIVVHCSAGIGRTGTFLAIHMARQQLSSGDNAVDVMQTVLHLREQ